ncbi:Prohibitin [Microtus ochrogaster]|uniref:Prohibitin n=1 Tax=Microtus ochrogaster TaxID=79684 RepID=A0A8J6L9I6_MICOH|nr:Prohibitin [Microtus ochrogaster]
MAAEVFESIGKFRLRPNLTSCRRCGEVMWMLGTELSSLTSSGEYSTLWYRDGLTFSSLGYRKPITFDCRLRAWNVPVVTGSKDLQNVNITLRILFRLVASPLPGIDTSIEAVEAKQVAQKEVEEAERARFVVEKSEQQKKVTITSAEGGCSPAPWPPQVMA